MQRKGQPKSVVYSLAVSDFDRIDTENQKCYFTPTFNAIKKVCYNRYLSLKIVNQ